MRLDWPLQVNDSELNFTAPWREVRWMRDSLSLMSLPAGAAASRHQETALKHIQVLHDFADRDIQGHIIPHNIVPMHIFKLLLLLGWYAVCSNHFASNLHRTNLRWFAICPNYTRLMYYTTGVL